VGLRGPLGRRERVFKSRELGRHFVVLLGIHVPVGADTGGEREGMSWEKNAVLGAVSY